MKKFFIAPIKAYQYISKMLPANCRYYPTCSEYAKWQFEFNRADKSLLASTLRILRCNQLFDGGIDYPIIRYTPPKLLCLSNDSIKVKYWIVPKDSEKFFVLKSFL
jgi:putative membrane protein insertion efficiency factor